MRQRSCSLAPLAPSLHHDVVREGMRLPPLRLALLAAAIGLSESFIAEVSSVGNRSRLNNVRPALSASHSDDPSVAALVDSHPVVSQVYPALLSHKEVYGHPNIPLGSKEGKQCETLRRLHIQGKLSDDLVDLLTKLGFRWHSLEDVYETCNFDDLYQRLIEYSKETGNLSPPKKFPADPELGAWVTGIRRLGHDKVLPAHAERLNAIGFEWTSPRKCGSAFMEQYREIQARLTDGEADIWDSDVRVQRWVKAQQEACARGALTETRKHYMATLLGEDWMDWKAE
jgi:hypothetical protein